MRRSYIAPKGLNDPRVPAGESEQIVQAVRANGVLVWYMLAKDEGHGMSWIFVLLLYNPDVVRCRLQEEGEQRQVSHCRGNVLAEAVEPLIIVQDFLVS